MTLTTQCQTLAVKMIMTWQPTRGNNILSTTLLRPNPKVLAREMGVRVRTAPTPAGWWGVYDHRRRLITLRPELAPIQYDCTLMHELGHAYYGHMGMSGKQELMADRWAAHHLLDFRAVVDAAGTERHTHDVAASLGVLPSVLKTYMQMLTKTQLVELRAMAAQRAA